jgi:hypothetical protein
MRGFGRTLLWRSDGGSRAFARANLRDWLEWPARISQPARRGALLAAVLVAAALVAAGLRPAGLTSWTRSLLALPQGRIVAPADGGNFRWIERAIAQCEAEAAHNADTLYFIVIPVVTDGDLEAWMPKANGTIGSSMLMLGSQDTLDGLRAGLLRLDRRTFDFSILDASSSKVYKWRPALGVHKFAIRDANAVAAFKPGFEIPVGADTTWADGGAIPREAGTCYWTGALMRG